MGSNYKSYGGKCGCSKRLKKAQRVPQRGPGVAELEKILSGQKQDQIKPLYAPPGTFHQVPLRAVQHQPVMFPPLPSQFPHSNHFPGNMYVKPCNQNGGVVRSDEGNLRRELSFTQMMMMGDAHDSKPNAHPMFQPKMNNPHPMPLAVDPVLNHFNEHSSSQRFYNKCTPTRPEEDQCALNRPRADMPSHPHPLNTQDLSQPKIENGRAHSDQERMMLRNILTLGPPSPTKGLSPQPTNPIYIETDSSENSSPNNSSDKGHQIQIFGFNLKDKDLSLDDTKLSLHLNAAQAEEQSLDLSLKL